MSSDPLRVLVVDDERLVRLGIRAALERQPDLVVIGEAGTGYEAIQICRQTRPDVILMDIAMPELDGVEATKRLMSTPPFARIIMLTTFDLDEYVYAALKAGAIGFLTKDTPPEYIADAVRNAARGDMLLAPDITRRLIEAYTQAPPPLQGVPQRLSSLTSRELDILTRIAHGQTNKQISASIFVSEATVKSNITHIFVKLGITDRVQAVIAAYETGLVRPEASD